MQTLEPPDGHYLSAAIGWLELGNQAEAKLELAQIDPAQQKTPAVLEVSWMIHAADRDWPAALESARTMIESAPDQPCGWLHQAYALRRVPGAELAAVWDALLPAWQKFPDEPVVPYNLACYACQLGRRTEALVWLKRAFSAGRKENIKLMALSDPDLEPLWSEIQKF